MTTSLELAYNTDQLPLTIPEYGRNVYQMINHAISIEDRKERTEIDNKLGPEEIAHTIVSILEMRNKGFVPEVKPRTFRHCTCEGTELALKNQRLLDLLRKEPRGIDPVSGAANVLVVSQRFRRIHARHMKHFVAFLREQNIRYR